MKSFLMFFYILDQCYADCKGDDLGAFLGAISPEIWADGYPADKAILNDWKELNRRQKISEKNILENTYDFLTYYELHFGFDFSETKPYLKEKLTNQIIKNALQKSCIIYEKHHYKD